MKALLDSCASFGLPTNNLELCGLLPITKSSSTEKSDGPNPNRTGKNRLRLWEKKALCWSLGRGSDPRPAAFLAFGYKAAAHQCPPHFRGHLPG